MYLYLRQYKNQKLRKVKVEFMRPQLQSSEKSTARR